MEPYNYAHIQSSGMHDLYPPPETSQHATYSRPQSYTSFHSMDGLSTPTQVSPPVETRSAAEKNEYPPLSARPSSSDACATIVQGLMHFNQSPEEDFSRKACESLVKKMKDKRDELDALIVSVYSRGEDIKKCITIARTLDGRLQVAGRKGFPHVVYAKIFRWPDLHKNELKHLPFCENAFDLKVDSVCVNPYHYERVINAGMGSIDMKPEDEGPDNPLALEDPLKHLPKVFYSMNTTGPKTMHPLIMDLGPPASPGPMYEPMTSPQPGPSNAPPPNRYMNFNSQMVPPHQNMMRQNMMQQPQMGQGRLPPPQLPPQQQQSSSSHHHQSPLLHQQHPHQQHPLPQQQQRMGQQHSQHPQQQQMQQQMQMQQQHSQRPQQPMQQQHQHRQMQQQQQQMPPPAGVPQRRLRDDPPKKLGREILYIEPHVEPPPAPGRLPPTYTEVIDISEAHIIRPKGAPPIGHITLPNPYPLGHPLCEIQDNYKTLGNVKFTRRNIVCVTDAEPPDPPLEVCTNWAKMYYHEDNRMLQQFTAKLTTVYVDCGYATAVNRFCLGSLCRTVPLMGPKADRLRLIGKGVRLSCKENGDVWIQNYGHNPVYVQSHYLDREAGRGVGDVIHKIYTGARIKIYDAERCKSTMKDQWISSLMEKCRMVSTGEITADDDMVLEDNLVGPSGEHIPLPLAKDDKNDPLTELFRYCVARLSFLEGWGPDYETRQTIDQCWAWMEIRINHAFTYLDTLLTDAHDAIHPLPPIGATRTLTFD